MTGQVATPNMAEVLYLLDRQHRIVDVGMRTGWPYGIEELCVTLEGENIDLDHGNYLRHGDCNLVRLPKAFEAVLEALARKSEAELASGIATGGSIATGGGV